MSRRAIATYGAVALIVVSPLVARAAGLAGSAGHSRAVPAAAGTTEIYSVPPGGAFTISGHGWGHGIGMSQWGAEGAAIDGQSAASILAFYYPGTATAVLAPSSIRVWLQEANPSALTVRTAAGLAVRDLATNAAYPLSPSYPYWRVVDDVGGFHVQYWTGDAWTVATLGGKAAWTGPMRFEGPSPLLTYLPDGSGREYDGSLTAVRSGTTTMTTVNTVTMEQYVAGVVPRESPASWAPAALQAQAVAARTYAAYLRARVPGGQAWDICDTTTCQVYGGRAAVNGGQVTDLEPATTDAATAATGGMVRTYGGVPILAEFSSSNGGYSVGVPGYPYLLAHADPYDAVANPNHVWTASVTPAQIESYFPAVGHLDDIAILTRDGNGDWGGRVLSVRLDGHDTAGHATAVTTTGAALALVNSWPQRSDGLRGNYFTVTSPSVVPGPAAAASGAGVRLFTQGSSADVVQQVYSGSAWSSGQSLGGRIVGGPWAAAAGTSGLVVVRGVDNALWSRAWQPTGWSGWQTAGGILTSQPAVANNSDGSMLAVARGRDGALWTTTYSAEGAWGPVWTSLGGVLSSDSDPAAVTYGSGELAAVVRAPDGSLWYRTRSASGWSAWLSAGGRSLGPIGATSYSSGRVDVFVRGTDNQVWHRWLAGTWSSWENLGGQAISGVSAVTTADGRLGVFVVGSDHRVWQKTYAAGWSAWSPVP